MNKNYKSTIIKKYGTDVEVHRYLGDKPMRVLKTKVLLGRGSRTNNNLKSFENRKEGIFLPDFDVSNGDFIINNSHNETYVVVSTHKEYSGNNILSIVTNLMVCNHTATVKGNTRVADDRGNIKSVLGVKYDKVPCYLEHVSSQLRQFEPGISPDTEHRLYTTDLNIDETDQIIVEMARRKMTFKVVAVDYMSFPGLAVVELSSDIRK